MTRGESSVSVGELRFEVCVSLKAFEFCDELHEHVQPALIEASLAMNHSIVIAWDCQFRPPESLPWPSWSC